MVELGWALERFEVVLFLVIEEGKIHMITSLFDGGVPLGGVARWIWEGRIKTLGNSDVNQDELPCLHRNYYRYLTAVELKFIGPVMMFVFV